MKYDHIISEVMSRQWAILPEKMRVISSLLALRASGKILTEEEDDQAHWSGETAFRTSSCWRCRSDSGLRRDFPPHEHDERHERRYFAVRRNAMARVPWRLADPAFSSASAIVVLTVRDAAGNVVARAGSRPWRWASSVRGASGPRGPPAATPCKVAPSTWRACDSSPRAAPRSSCAGPRRRSRPLDPRGADAGRAAGPALAPPALPRGADATAAGPSSRPSATK